MNQLQNAPLSLEDEHEKLLSEAYASDVSETLSSEQASSAEQDTEDKGEPEGTRATDHPEVTTPDNPEPSADGRLRGPDGKFLPKDAALEVKEMPTDATPAKQESAYSKAQKEQARLAKSWQAVEAEKLELRKLADELRQERQQRQAQQQQNSGVPRFDSKEYTRASNIFKDEAKKLFQEGDIDGGNAKLKLSDEVAAEGQRMAQQEAQAQQSQFQQSWSGVMNEVIKEEPRVAQGGEWHQEMAELMNQKPILGMYRDGFRDAYEVVKMRKEAAEASGLRDENTKLKSEIERLTKLTTPSGGNDAAKHGTPQRVDDMPIAQLHKKLEREAELADAY